MFKVPENEEIFNIKRLPGNYKELVKKYGVGGKVSEMDSYEAKCLCTLKAIDDNDICYLQPINGNEIVKVSYK